MSQETVTDEILTRRQLIDRFGHQAYRCLEGTIQTGFRVSSLVQVSVVRRRPDEFAVTTYTKVAPLTPDEEAWILECDRLRDRLQRVLGGW